MPADFPIIDDSSLVVAKLFDIVALALNDIQAQEKHGTLDIKLPYLRFAKVPT